MLVGYARVSKNDGQDTTIQIEALKAAGATKIFEEVASGGRWDRPALHKALDQLREGDVFIVKIYSTSWKKLRQRMPVFAA